MKKSKYNFFFESDEENKVIAYNAMTNSLALLEKEKFNQIEDILEGNCNDKELIDNLKKGQFLIEDDVNELEVLRLDMLSSRFNTDSLGITIAPTLGCNFDCVYCYEENHDDFSKMDEETQQALVKHVKSQANTISNLSITWYGGEPLAAFDVIENLSKQFIEICEENNVEYFAGIVTNGYLLSEEILSKFNDLKINFMQVTLDGTEEYHDSRRFLKGGQGTFNRIVNNLAVAKGYVENIALRINTDKENSNKVTEVLDVLEEKELLTSVNPYLGFVDSYNDCYNKDTCLSANDFSNVDINFYEELKNKGVSVDKLSKYPTRVYNYCTADSSCGFVIDNKGDLYKCWNDVGRADYKFGNINENTTLTSNMKNLLLYDPTTDEECVDCEFLPICMGGCPSKRMNNLSGKCTEQKYNIQKYLDIVVKNIKDER